MLICELVEDREDYHEGSQKLVDSRTSEQNQVELKKGRFVKDGQET